MAERYELRSDSLRSLISSARVISDVRCMIIQKRGRPQDSSLRVKLPPSRSRIPELPAMSLPPLTPSMRFAVFQVGQSVFRLLAPTRLCCSAGILGQNSQVDS